MAPSITSGTSYSVEEGSTAVATLSATDPQGDALTWSIADPAGLDGALFTLSETGALAFLDAPDFEDPGDSDADRVYEVTVKVSDATNAVTADLEVTVTDVSPALAGPTTATYAEGNRGMRVATYRVDDGDTWSLAGDDAAKFTVAGGYLRFVDPPDYESASDQGTDNVYSVTVQAGDGTTSETIAVAVTVTNVEEPGVVTLSPPRPKLSTALMAAVTDPDGVNGTPAWRWERANGREGWTVIDGATGASYTPAAADADRYLRATATYTDGLGAGKSAGAIAPHVVIAHRLRTLTVSGLSGVLGDSRAFYPAFDADTLHYAARCPASISLTLTPEDSDTRVSVNGMQRPKGAAFTLGGLNRETDIRITLTGGTGASTTYTVHCIDRGEFPKLTTVKRAGAMDDLLLFKAAILPTGQWWRSYLVLMDNNGVPRLRKLVVDRVYTYFRVFPDETHPRARYGYFKLGSSHNPDGVELVVLDKYFNTEAEDIHILSPFSNTDGHDFMIRPNGDYVLMAYSPTRRDLRFINSEFPRVRNQQGGTLRRDQPVRDSVIQVRTADGTVKFNWNGWDHLAIEDCIIARNLSSGYAHINALGWIDGDVIAGFRGCSKILRIDLDTGNVVWRAGPSLRNREQWEAGETLQADRGPAPLDFVNDPAGGFSGQHGGQITADGHLLVYDNSTHCTTPPGVPVELKGLKQCGRNTRAVAYAIDVANEELVFQREFRIPGSNYQGPSGHAEPMNNGDWLISWSNARPPPNTAMQVDAETGTEKFSMTIVNITGSDAGTVDNSRVLTVSPVALAARIEPLEATIASKPAFHGGTADRPVVVVAFNRPVVDVASATPSVRVTGATVAVAAHEEAGARANAYAFTLTPAGEGSIRFQLNADGACNSDAVCTADGAQLMTVPGELVIPGPVVVNFGAQTSVTEGGSVNVVATLNKAHGRGGDLAIPLRLGAGSTASAADVSIPESVSFDETETSKSVAVSAFNDALVEGAETAQLEFGTLPRGVTAGGATTVTIADATDDTLQFTVGATEVAEGNSTELVFAAGTGISFTTDQTISLTVDGTAAAGDYTLAAGGRTLAAPYAVELPAGANSVSATLSVVNDTEAEDEENILVEATAGGESLGIRLIAVPANDRDLPDVSVSAGAGAITEGANLAFTLRRTGATTDALAVDIRVAETGAMLGATPPVSGTIPAGAATVDLSVTTDNDSVVESDSEVTLQVTARSSYEVGAPATATATVVDDDAASFMLTVAPLEIVEGEEADVTVSIDNGVTFAADQSIDIATEGTARLADSVLAVDGNALDPPYALTLAAGAMSTTAKLLAVDDDERETAQTLTLGARHGSAFIGRTTVTLAASDAPTQVSIAAAAAAVTEGDPVAFTLTRARVTEPTRLPALTVPVAVLDPGRNLADAAPTEVTFAADATSTTLSLATTDDQVIPEAPAEVTATIVTPDGNGAPAYVVAGEPTARVSVTNDDEAEFAVSVTPTEVAEGGRVTVTVTIENSVTFSETQTVAIFKEGRTGTAAAGVDYTVHAPNDNERDRLRLRSGRDSATGTIRVKYDAVAEGPETILIAAAHGGSVINEIPVTITIEANDGWSDPNAPPALAFAEVAGATLTLTFDHALDLASIPAATDFEVRVAGVPVSVDAVRVSGRTVVLTLESVPAHGQSVTVSYTPGNDRVLDAQAGEAAGFAGVTVVETLVSIDPGRASEGDTVRFGVRLSQPVEDALTVNWRVHELSAEAGVDYPDGQTGMLTVPSGATTGEIAVSTTEDTERETDEKFVVLLEKPVGFPAWAGLAQSAAAGTIVDDDGGGGTGGGTGGGGGGGANHPPVVERIIPNQTVQVGKSVDIDIRLSFYDRDQRALDYAVESADPSVATVEVDRNGMLTIRGVRRGVTAITVSAADRRGETASQTFAVTVLGPALVPFFPRADDALGRQGFVRLINHSEESGEVAVEAIDDTGTATGPVALTLDTNETVHFNSSDLENGNADKGLVDGVGSGEGDWRLVLDSDVDFEVLSYIRTEDGFLTSVHDVAPMHDGSYRVALFNPASNPNQVSRLRLINSGAADATVTIEGVDDAGASPGTAVEFDIPALRSITLTAADLERGTGMSGALGNGTGKWRLSIESTERIGVMSLLSSPTGHLTNLSTLSGTPSEDGDQVVPLFPAASDPLGRQGFLRVVNGSDAPGTVSIEAFDDSGLAYPAVTLALNAEQTRHFNSDDLELGNTEKGLTGSTGPGMGDWRLVLSSELDIQVLAYIRTSDGFLTSMHDLAPGLEGEHRIAIFNPGSNPNQVSWLRLVNPGTEDAEVTIAGIDDAGASPGSVVVLTVPAGGSRTIPAAELESGGEGLSGALGDGVGKWRLRVESEEPIVVMSLLSSPTGHLTNLSTAPGGGSGFSLGEEGSP